MQPQLYASVLRELAELRSRHAALRDSDRDTAALGPELDAAAIRAQLLLLANEKNDVGEHLSHVLDAPPEPPSQDTGRPGE